MDFATLLRDLMRERQMTGRGLARRVPCDASLISRLACGRQRPSARMAARLDEVLEAAGALAGAARPGVTARAVPAWLADEHGDDDDVRRRELLGAMVAGPLALQLEQIRRHLDGVPGSVSERDADEWERVAAGYAVRVQAVPAAVYLPHLLADAGEVTDRVLSASGGVRVRLTRAAALIAALTAHGLAGIGDEMTAGRWWRTAARIAGESGDPALVALVVGKRATHAVYVAGDEPAALGLAEAALSAAGGRACAGAAFAHAARAQAYAGLGRRAEAMVAVDDQRRVWERLPDGDVRAAGAFGVPERRVLHTRAWVLARLGENRTALPAVDAYLACPASVEGRARVELLRAEALIRSGDVAGGARHCVRVITALPARWRGEGEVVASARAAIRAVPGPLAASRPVREAREVLALPAG